jgi:hypothetical protein
VNAGTPTPGRGAGAGADVGRRDVLRGLAAALAALPLAGAGIAILGPVGAAAAASGTVDAISSATKMTLEAFADTMIPGAKRYPGDAAVAGVTSGPGGAHAGFAELLQLPELGIGALLPGLATSLDAAAVAYAVAHLILLPIGVPPFVGLGFTARTAVVDDLVSPAAVGRLPWVLLGLMVGIAFDAAGHLHTVDAVRGGHPGLAFLRFPPPDADGVWRFPAHSYGRQLAIPHPNTTPTGSPA